MKDLLSFQIPLGVVVFSLGLWLIQWLRYWWYLSRKFDNKQFEIYWKDHPDIEPYRIVKCTVSKNVMKFESLKKSQPFYGELIFNPISLQFGKGYQVQTNSDGFNFPEVVIKDDSTILMQTNYISIAQPDSKVGDIYYQAFVWRKVVSPKKS